MGIFPSKIKKLSRVRKRSKSHEIIVTDKFILEECSICLSVPEIGETLKILNCGHSFHLTCCEEWKAASLKRGTEFSCPMCRISIL